LLSISLSLAFSAVPFFDKSRRLILLIFIGLLALLTFYLRPATHLIKSHGKNTAARLK
jgi:hypothetical protein